MEMSGLRGAADVTSAKARRSLHTTNQSQDAKRAILGTCKSSCENWRIPAPFAGDVRLSCAVFAAWVTPQAAEIAEECRLVREGLEITLPARDWLVGVVGLEPTTR